MKAKFYNYRLLLLVFFLFPLRFFPAAQPGPCCPSSCNTGPNLVVNGNFSGPCLTGYQSDLTQYPCDSSGFGWNGYTEVYDANHINPAWTGIEHTGDGGHALILDGPGQGTPRAWYQNINMQQGKVYCFEAWFLNTCPTCPVIPQFEIRIGGIRVGAVLLQRNGQWIKFCIQYTATASGPVELAIHMQGDSNIGGNDAMIDDISFREISASCCCDQIIMTKTVQRKAPDLCCVTLNINAPASCNIAGVEIGPPYNYQLFTWPAPTAFPLVIGPLCIPRGPQVNTTVTFYDKCGNVICTKPLSVFCDIIVTVEDPLMLAENSLAKGQLEIFPNPAANSIMLKMNYGGKPASGRVAIIDGSGRTVQQQRVTIPPENITIDISALKPGSYFIRYTDDSGTQKKAAFIKG